MDEIYLDNNASTRLDPRVADAMSAVAAERYGNPASAHSVGRAARRRLEQARDEIAQQVGCLVDRQDADRVVFTSGGTEANNLAIRGLATERPGQVIVSSLEHPSVQGAADALVRAGVEVLRLPAHRDGTVDVTTLEEWLEAPTRLVSVMAANNETGVVQPLARIAELCQAAETPLHTDAVQAIGKQPFSFRDLPLAAMSVSAHKVHGPQGIGALVLRAGESLDPLLFGGFQQGGLRPGTEAIAPAVGFAEALRLAAADSGRSRRMQELRETLERLLLSAEPSLQIVGSAAERLPHTSNLAFPGLDRQALLMALDARGVACSTGSACASGSSEPSPVLQAMGLPAEVVEGSIRLSLGADTTAAEVREAATRILEAVEQLRRFSPPTP